MVDGRFGGLLEEECDGGLEPLAGRTLQVMSVPQEAWKENVGNETCT